MQRLPRSNHEREASWASGTRRSHSVLPRGGVHAGIPSRYCRISSDIFAGTGVKAQVVAGNPRTQQRTLNPRVRGSSSWRCTRTDLGFHHSRSFLCPVCPHDGPVLAGESGRSRTGFVVVRDSSTVVAGELGQDLTQMPLAEDQDVIEALAPERSGEPFGKGAALVADDQQGVRIATTV